MTNTISSEQLDRLRAGLYDDQPEQREQVQAAAGDGEAATEGDRWASMLAEMDVLADSSVTINNQLRLRRRRVLAGKYRDRSTRLPRLALATSAVIALIVAATFILRPAGPVAVTSTAVPGGEWREVLDLADNVDFYHWMEHRAAVATDQKGT